MRTKTPMKTPTLETSTTSGKSRHALAAANIRRELRATFPAHKFTIRSNSYSGGDSIDIKWTLGPTEHEVSAITNKYQTGTFNGMIDLYEYDTDRSFTAIHGGSKYVFTRRDIDTAIAPIIRDLHARMSNLSDYEAQTYAYRILAKHAVPAGATITGLQSTDRTGGLVEDIFAPTFTNPTVNT
jgi:Large polyvalent protein associated domain 29